MMDNPTNKPRDRPIISRKPYSIVPQVDGTVDVYLRPEVRVYHTDLGIREFDITVRLIRGIIPWDGLEDDIRARYQAWCDSAEVIDL